MAKSEMSSNKKQKEALEETSLWHVHSSHSVKASSTFPRLKVGLWGFCEGIVSGNQRPVSSKEMSSIENWREAFCATLLWCLYSSHRAKSFFGLSSLKSLFLWNLRKDIWKCSLEYPEKEITSERNLKEDFCETALCHVYSAHTLKLLFSLSCIITLFLFSLRRNILEGLRLTVRNETSSDGNWREPFCATLLWCLYSSHSVKSFFGLTSLKSLFLWIWERTFGNAP